MSEVYRNLEDEKFEFGKLTKEEQSHFLDFVKSKYSKTVDVWRPLWTFAQFLPNPKILLSSKYDLFFSDKKVSLAELIRMQKEIPRNSLEFGSESKIENSPPLSIFENCLKETRERLDANFRELCLVKMIPIDSPLYFNILSTVLTVAYVLKLYNGEFDEEPLDFVNDIVAICPILRPDHKEYLASHGMVFALLSERLVKSANPRIEAILHPNDCESLVGNRYLMAEVLYVCYEAIDLAVACLERTQFRGVDSQSTSQALRLVQKKLLFYIDFIYKMQGDLLNRHRNEFLQFARNSVFCVN